MADTVQFAWGGLLNARPASPVIHLVVFAPDGTLCGLPMFEVGGPGWARGGGVSDPAAVPCLECAAAMAPGTTVVRGSLFRHLFATLDKEADRG